MSRRHNRLSKETPPRREEHQLDTWSNRLDVSGGSDCVYDSTVREFKYGDCLSCYEQGKRQSECNCSAMRGWCSRESLVAAMSGVILGASLGAGITAGAYEASARCGSDTGSGLHTAARVGYSVGRAAGSAVSGDYTGAYNSLASAYDVVASGGGLAANSSGPRTSHSFGVNPTSYDEERTARWVSDATTKSSRSGYQGSFRDLDKK
jgi:hypothetical protein